MRAFTWVLVLMLSMFSCGCGTILRLALGHPHPSRECTERGKAFSARAEKLKRDAPEVLKLGAKKEIVVRFLQENGIPPEFLGNEITGTIHLKGCAPSGCGSDDALLGLRVGVDKKGTVTSKPSVGALYTDCLQALSAGGIPHFPEGSSALPSFACSGFGDSRLKTL